MVSNSWNSIIGVLSRIVMHCHALLALVSRLSPMARPGRKRNGSFSDIGRKGGHSEGEAGTIKRESKLLIYESAQSTDSVIHVCDSADSADSAKPRNVLRNNLYIHVNSRPRIHVQIFLKMRGNDGYFFTASAATQR